MVKWEITTLLNAGSWTISGGKPVIKEFQPLGKRNPRGRKDPLDTHFKSLLKFQRVVIIQLAELDRDDQGFQRTHESPGSNDEFELSVKSRKYSDTNDIFVNARNILVNQPTSGTYAWFEVGDLEPNTQRGRYIYTSRIIAHYTGKVRDSG
jgi:hypothetical protein